MVDSMTRAFGSPLRYVQGPGEFNHLSDYTREYGKACILVDGFLYDQLNSRLKEIYRESESEFIAVCFQGECCQEEIERVVKTAKAFRAEVIVGVGGGKALDIAKLCAKAMNVPIIIVPTSASTDAPVSEIAVLYTQDGEYLGSQKMNKNANLVLVDSEIIVKAPRRLFVAGIGDALATWFEAHACELSDSPNYIGTGHRRCKAGMAIAKTCMDILLAEGESAVFAVEQGIITEAFEDVVEANILLSGLGFLNTGLATAHGIHSALTVLPETHKYLHGEKVAFGIVCQMILENTPSDLFDQFMRFMTTIGLPVTLKQLGVEASQNNIMAVARKAVESQMIHNESFLITVDSVYSAIVMADQAGKKYLSESGEH